MSGHSALRATGAKAKATLRLPFVDLLPLPPAADTIVIGGQVIGGQKPTTRAVPIEKDNLLIPPPFMLQQPQEAAATADPTDAMSVKIAPTTERENEAEQKGATPKSSAKSKSAARPENDDNVVVTAATLPPKDCDKDSKKKPSNHTDDASQNIDSSGGKKKNNRPFKNKESSGINKTKTKGGFPWDNKAYYTPPNIDIRSEEVIENPMEYDWLGDGMRQEAEMVGWPRGPAGVKSAAETVIAACATTHDVLSSSSDKRKESGAEHIPAMMPVEMEIEEERKNAALAEQDRAENDQDQKLPSTTDHKGDQGGKTDNENYAQNESEEGGKSLAIYKEHQEQRNESTENGDQDDMPDGVANPEAMKDHISKLFYPGRQFLNIYQAKQFADYASGRWGVRLKLASSSQIGCTFGGQHAKQKETKQTIRADPAAVKSPTADNPKKTRVRREAPLAATQCPFRICLGFQLTGAQLEHEPGKKIPRTLNPVRVLPASNCFEHNHECSMDTFDYAVRKAGGNHRPTGPNQQRPIIPTSNKRKRVEGDDGEVDAYRGPHNNPLPKNPQVEQRLFPWGSYYTPETAVQALKNNNNLKPMDVDWLRGPLMEEVKAAWPRPGDISEDLVSDSTRMDAAVAKVFYPNRQFCNMYQAQQLADLVLGRWGAKVKQNQSSSLGCCYGHPSLKTKRRWNDGVPFKRKKSASAISATGCPFVISFTFRFARFQNGKATDITRVSNPVRVTICHLSHNHECSAKSLRVLKQTSGAYTQNIDACAWRDIMAVLEDPEERDMGAAIREIVSPFFAPTVEITPSVLANIRTRGRAMLAGGEIPHEIAGAEANEFFARKRKPWQSLDMSETLREHFTVISGFENNIKSNDNPNGCLDWFCSPEGWGSPCDGRGRGGHWTIDANSGALVLYPAAKKDFRRRTHHEPVLIKDDGAILYGSLECSRHYTVETCFTLVGVCKSDQAGLFVRLDDEHWLKVGVESIGDDTARLVCVITNCYSDSSSHPWHSEMVNTADRLSPGQEKQTVLRAEPCFLRVNCRGTNFTVEAKADDSDDWDVVRIAHVSKDIVEKCPSMSTVTDDDDDDYGEKKKVRSTPHLFWAGVYGCCPEDQQGGHAVFDSFHVFEIV